MANNSFYSFAKLPKSARIFLLSEFFFGFASGVIALNLNFYLHSRAFTNYTIGLLAMIGSVSMAVFSLLSGAFSDKAGKHTILVGGSLIQGVGFFITAFSPGIGGLVLGQVLQSGGSACVRTCEFPYVTALVDNDQDKQNVYFLLIYSFSISNIAGTLAGGFLPQLFTSMENPYMIPVLIGGISYGTMGVARIGLVRDQGTRNGSAAAEHRKLSLMSGDGRIGWYLIFQVLYQLGNSLGGAQLNLVYKERFSIPNQLIGTLFSTASIITVVTLTLLPALLRVCSRDKAAIVMLLIVAACFGLSAVRSAPLFIAMVFLRSCFVQFYGVVIEQPMLVSIDEKSRGLYSGMRLCAGSLGEAAGAWTAGYFLSFLTYPLLMGTTVFVFALLLLVYIFKCRKYMYAA